MKRIIRSDIENDYNVDCPICKNKEVHVFCVRIIMIENKKKIERTYICGCQVPSYKWRDGGSDCIENYEDSQNRMANNISKFKGVRINK